MRFLVLLLLVLCLVCLSQGQEREKGTKKVEKKEGTKKDDEKEGGKKEMDKCEGKGRGDCEKGLLCRDGMCLKLNLKKGCKEDAHCPNGYNCIKHNQRCIKVMV